jgi:hypothetical protein
MDTTQLTTLGNHIRANSDVAALLSSGNLGGIRDHYNGAASPGFWVWENAVPAGAVGDAISLKDLGNLIAANAERLQAAFTLVGVNSGNFHATDPDTRAFFADMFSGAAGTTTRPKLLAVWQRQATVAEKVFATGTGTEATGEIDDGTGLPAGGDPATLVWEGAVSTGQVDLALELTA